jgi:peptidoglycan/xylan/chitin deacetylase (PgdA/CDA1 family)
MYHMVIDPADLGELDAHSLHPKMYVTKRTLAMQMEYLSRNYRVIEAAQLVSAAKEGTVLPRNACVITFDDGWKGTYTYALPILKKYNLPATVFLVSQYVGANRWFWPEKVSVLLSKYLAARGSEGHRATAWATKAGAEFSTILSDPHLTPTKKIATIIEALKAVGRDDRDKIIHELEEALAAHHIRIAYSERLIVNWDEVAEMSKHRITFGAHTETHPILTKIPLPEAIREIAQSKVAIEKQLGTVCPFFCYPNGDYNDEVKTQVMAHYSCAFSTDIGFVKPNDDLFTLKRIGISDEGSRTRAQFACKASGILEPLLNVLRGR